MMNLKGNQVKIISGKRQGKKTGEILEIDRKKFIKDKVNQYDKKHLKPTKQNKGGIISKENFLHQSNVKNRRKKRKKKKGSK